MIREHTLAALFPCEKPDALLHVRKVADGFVGIEKLSEQLLVFAGANFVPFCPQSTRDEPNGKDDREQEQQKRACLDDAENLSRAFVCGAEYMKKYASPPTEKRHHSKVS